MVLTQPTTLIAGGDHISSQPLHFVPSPGRPNKPPHTRVFGTLTLLGLLLRFQRMVFLPLFVVPVCINRRVKIPVCLLEVEKGDVVSEVEGDACQYISTARDTVISRIARSERREDVLGNFDSDHPPPDLLFPRLLLFAFCGPGRERDATFVVLAWYQNGPSGLEKVVGVETVRLAENVQRDTVCQCQGLHGIVRVHEMQDVWCGLLIMLLLRRRLHSLMG